MFQFRIPAFLSWCLLLLIMGRALFVQSVFLSCCSCDWQNNWCRFFYASSACIYPEFKQLETNVSLKESDAWPAEVTIIYNLVFFCKKLFSIPLKRSLFCTDGINGQELIHPGYREDLRSIMKHVGSGGCGGV
jgi:hypothetical protein